MKKSFVSISLILIFTILLSACGNNNKQTEVVATAIAQTIEAMNRQTPQVTYVVVTPENTAVSLPTATPLPASTALPTSTPIPAPTTSPHACNAVSFVSENPVDGATFAPGATFTKSWRFKNVGTCTWNPNYKVVYSNGNTITGADTKKLPNYVAPGETTDIVYTFKAPSTAGTYQTVFNLKDDEGNVFAQFWVQFKVKSTAPTSTATPAFAVSNVTFSSSDASISDTCPQTFDYSAAITTNGAGTITYHWVFSNGAKTTPKTLTYSGAGTKTVSGIWEINASGSYWAKLYIDEPNHQLFGQLNLSLTCLPTFAVTGVTFSSSDPTITGTCPQTFDHSAAITTNRAGTVTYHWVFSDGSTTTPESITFSGAGTKTVSDTWDLGTSGAYWVKLYIDEPNHQLFGKLDLNLTCTTAFEVTGVTLSADPETYTGDCSAPIAFDYQADIAANGAGTVTYLITFSDGTSVGTDSLPFSSAGTQSVTGTWNIDTPVSDTYWFSIYIDNPNHQLFGPHNITVICTP